MVQWLYTVAGKLSHPQPNSVRSLPHQTPWFDFCMEQSLSNLSNPQLHLTTQQNATLIHMLNYSNHFRSCSICSAPEIKQSTSATEDASNPTPAVTLCSCQPPASQAELSRIWAQKKRGLYGATNIIKYDKETWEGRNKSQRQAFSWQVQISWHILTHMDIYIPTDKKDVYLVRHVNLICMPPQTQI